ncbi:MAG: general secretion pathway protein GspB [Thermomonas sp.]
MSLILEALRKSEAERRRGEMPDLRAELPPPASARRSSLRHALPWIVALAAIGIAAMLWLHPWSRDAATTASAPLPAPTTTPSEGVRLQPRPQVPAAPRTETPRIAEREPPKPQPVAPVATPVPAPEPTPRPAVEATPTPAPSAEAETTVGALPADLRKALPPLQLSMHLWDPDPAKRFVILDGERRVEGDSVGPMQIRRIDADGVLFDWQGRAVRLPLR